MIEAFVKTCRDNADKTAFVSGKRHVSFSRLLSDVYKTVNMFSDMGLARGSRVLLLVLPSYEFYVLLFACIYYGINVVVMDSYRDAGRIRRVIGQNGITHAFCNRKTAPLCTAMRLDVERINVSRYASYPDTPTPPEQGDDYVVLTTFTSGTTGDPKPVERTLTDLQAQIEVVSRNIEITSTDVVWANLPIYTLFVVYTGMTCIIDRRMSAKRLKELGVNAVLASISSLLSVRGCATEVRRLYFGGAVLYPAQAKELQRIFPNAEVNYIYGSSECVLMAKGTPEHYIAHGNAMQSGIDGVELSLADCDPSGVGRICARGRVVLTPDHTVKGSDLGYIDEHGLHIVGRAQYSRPDCYNYLTDMRLLLQNPRVKKGFSFLHEDRLYFCYQGRLTNREEGVTYVCMHKIPMDAKHKTKPDYARLIAHVARKHR